MKNKKMLFLNVLMILSVSTACYANSPGYVYPTTLNQSAVIFDYNELKQYNIRTKLGYITDIQLRSGEKLQDIVAGDTERWMVSSANIAGTVHVYVKPLQKNVKTNIIVISDARSYRFVATSADIYDDIVIFNNVPLSEKEKAAVEAAAAKAKVSDAKEKIRKYREYTEKYNWEYEFKKIKDVSQELLPVEIYNTKTKTYIKLPNENNQELPIIYRENLNGKLSLINYRMRDGYMVIDAVMSKMRLVYGENSYITIENLPLSAIENIDKKEANEIFHKKQLFSKFKSLVNRKYIVEPEKVEISDEIKKAYPLISAEEEKPIVVITSDSDKRDPEFKVSKTYKDSIVYPEFKVVSLKDRLKMLNRGEF